MKELTVIGFGDSLTYGYGVNPKSSFMDKLRLKLPLEYQDIKWNVLNRGVNGDTSSDGVKRLKADVLDYFPNIVTILFGSNDSALDDYQHLSLEGYAINMDIIISGIQKSGAIPLVISPPPIVEEEYMPYVTLSGIKRYGEIAKAVSEKKGAPFLDLFQEMLAASNGNLGYYLQYDGVHINEKGYELIFPFIYQKIVSLLVL